MKYNNKSSKKSKKIQIKALKQAIQQIHMKTQK